MWTKSVQMSKVQMLRSLVEQRLTAAAEEIFGLFERTIAEYEEELCRTKEENQRKQQILDDVRNQKVLIHRTVRPADVHQLSLVKEEVLLEQQEWSPSLDQDQDQEDPQPPNIKEEQEELWTSQEADITKFLSAPVPVKSEDDEEEAQSSQLHQRQTEENREDCGGSGPASSFHPHRHLQTHDNDQTEDSEDTDGDWRETRESYLNHHTYYKTAVMDVKFNGKKCFFCPLCGTKFAYKKNVRRHVLRYHTAREILSCPFCSKTFTEKENLKMHIAVHTGEKRYRCCVCDKSFMWRSQVKNHKCVDESSQPPRSKPEEDNAVLASGSNEQMGTGAGGLEPDRVQSSNRVQIEDLKCRPAQNFFSCSKCRRGFDNKGSLETHMDTHTGERPFVCQFCGNKYKRYSSLSCHLNIHKGETRFRCRLCDQRFTRWTKWRTHKCILCKSCNRRFTCLSLFKRHKCGVESATQENTGEIKPESVVEDCGGSEPASSSHPDHYLQPESETEYGSESGADNVWKETSQKSDLNSQIKSESDMRHNVGEKSHHCSECGKRFCTKSLLQIHMRVHTGEKPFGCSECGARFSQKSHLLRHIKSHTGQKPFSCSVCTERFTQKQSLIRHMTIHTRQMQDGSSVGEIKIIQSVIHQGDIVTDGHLQQGMDTQTEDTTENVVEEKCCTETRKPESHLNKETEDQTERAGECGQSKQSGNLDPDTDDKTVNSSEFSVVIVDDCRETNQLSGLNSQIKSEVSVSDMRLNTSEKSHACAECGKRFCTRSLLQIHMRVHTGEKPFGCTECGTRFSQKANLFRHMISHTGAKPFSCSVCKERFTQKNSLKKHMNIHMREKQETQK